MKEFKCPSCGVVIDTYDSVHDTLHCEFCKLTISRELALDMIKGTPIWITENMRCFRIDMMETSHIQNCIGMIFRRNSGWRGRFMGPLITELKKRTEQQNESLTS